MTKRKLLEKERKEAQANLRERVKEQECLYSITSLYELTVEKLLERSVTLIPQGWQYPDMTAVSIEFEDQKFRSNNYRDTDRKLTAKRTCLNGSKLIIHVVTLEQKPPSENRTFLEEEEQLIDTITGHLALKIDHLLSSKELKEKERRLDRMGRMARIGYWEIDLNNEKVHCSAMTKEIFELDDDIIPDLKTALSFFKAGEDRETISQALDDAINQGKPYDMELRIISGKGNERWIRTIGEPEMNEDGICVRLDGSFQDIDDRKRTRFESERRRLLLETISNETEAAIWVRDSEGRYLFVNKEVVKILQIEDEQILGKTVFEVLDETTANGFRNKDNKVLSSNRPIKAEERISTPQGDRYYLTNMFPLPDIPDVGKGVAGFATDITERKQVEDKLKFNSRLLNEIGEAVISTDPDGKITYWNNAAEQLYGWTQCEALGQNIIDITPSIASKEFGAEIFSSLVEGESWSGDFEVERKDGTRFPARVTTSPVQDDEGNLLAIVGISSDITERKAREQKIEESLREKELLLGEIHHRVKNNLAIISSLITLQMMDVEDEKFRRMLENTNNRIHSIAMVHELLYQSDDFAKIPFKKYIGDLLGTIKKTIDTNGSNVDLVTDVKIGGLNINQAIPLGLMLNELMTNSLKYAFKNNKKGKINVGISRSGNKIEVLYEDNGDGYPDHIDFTDDTGNFGQTLILTLLNQLSEGYNVETNGKFRLDFQFEERTKGAHSNISG